MASGENNMRVAVMGPTGSGKSTFINVASGSHLAVSDSLESCTIDVEMATFSLDGRTITLIDTPGFDDTVRSDTEVLKSITDHLSNSYMKGSRLTGVIYMHRISDNKMGGPSRRNFHILRNLIGDDNLHNVLLVTNMWNKVDPEDGKAREQELATKEKFFKPALDKDARLLRHDGSQASAHMILRQLFGRVPSTLLVEDEMVNQKKDLAHTTVGVDVMNTLKEQAERHAEALDDLCLGIEAARLAEDEETREILQEEARKAREKIERVRSGLEKMVTNFATENTRLEDENRRYKKYFNMQKAGTEVKDKLLDQERNARELAEEGKRQAESRLAAERELGKHRKGGEVERGDESMEGEKRELQGHQPNEDKERLMRKRQEREKQPEEYRKTVGLLTEHTKNGKERAPKVEKIEEKASSYSCVVQ